MFLEPIVLPYGSEAGDMTPNLQLDIVSDVYRSGSIFMPEIQVDSEAYDRFYVRHLSQPPNPPHRAVHECFT